MSNDTKKIRDDLKAVTLTIIFEASALNRDEKIGGNIPSIKKLTRFGNKTFGYLSREAIRHYLFETLWRRFPNDWNPTPTYESGSGENKVVQFDLRKANILTNAEIDAFGYMFTEKKTQGQKTENITLTRKKAVGITKAVALETWEGDMQFNANHDIASRCGADPNPVNKEEQVAYFKVSFTIDIDKIGQDKWLNVNDVNQESGKITIKFPAGLSIEINDVTSSNQNEYELNNIGKIKYIDNPKSIEFILSPDEKLKRICQILHVLKNGLFYDTSGENYGIVPKFIIAAGLKLPIPIFHSFVELGSFEETILDNAYILNNRNSKKMVYIYNPKKLVGEIDETKYYTNWNEFLQDLSLNCQE